MIGTSEIMSKKILVILGHPQAQSFGGALAAAYVEGARASGAQLRELHLGELKFNPVLAVRPDQPPELEPDLKQAQEDIRWAEHLVFVYPIMWGTLPALLKGFIERSFTPGFAMNFRPGSRLWDRLLTGRSARLIVTLNTPPFIYRWFFGRPGHNTMKRAILGFCGVRPVRLTEVAPLNRSTPKQRERWLAEARELGRRQV